MPKSDKPRGSRTPLPVAVEYTDEDQVVSYSELDTYRQCPLKHLLGYNQRWTKPTLENSPLTKGTLWHNVMETHYLTIQAAQIANRGRRLGPVQQINVLRDARAAVEKWFSDPFTTEQTENQALVQWMYEGYVEMWGADPDWKIIGVEYRLAAYLPDPLGLRGDERVILKAKLDLIVMDYNTGHFWVVDHKSGANLPNQMDLEIDDQFGLYSWLMKQAGSPILGSMHNAARTTRNVGDFPDPPKGKKPQTLEQRHHRTLLNRTDVELANIANDAAMASYYTNPPEGVTYPLYSSPDPRNCGWKCDFKEVHMIARTGRKITEVLQEYGFKQDFTRH